MTTVLNDYKETVLPKSSLFDLLQNTTSIDEIKSSLHGSRTSLIDKEETQQDSFSALSTVEKNLKNSNSTTCELESPKLPKLKDNNFI